MGNERGTNGERMGQILLVRWGAADGGLLVTGEGVLRGGFGCWDVCGMVLVWLLAFGRVKEELALHRCSVLKGIGPSTSSGRTRKLALGRQSKDPGPSARVF